MNKRITVELTEDQASKIIGALQSFTYPEPEMLNGEIAYGHKLDKYEIDHNAFIERLVRKIQLARAKA